MESATSPFPPGARVEYFSATTKHWIPAVIVEFFAHTGQYKLDIKSSAPAKNVRAGPNTDDTPCPGDAVKPAPIAFAAGQSVQVWSVSKNAWVDATVETVEGNTIHIFYPVGTGQVAKKRLLAGHKHLRQMVQEAPKLVAEEAQAEVDAVEKVDVEPLEIPLCVAQDPEDPPPAAESLDDRNPLDVLLQAAETDNPVKTAPVEGNSDEHMNPLDALLQAAPPDDLEVDDEATDMLTAIIEGNVNLEIKHDRGDLTSPEHRRSRSHRGRGSRSRSRRKDKKDKDKRKKDKKDKHERREDDASDHVTEAVAKELEGTAGRRRSRWNSEEDENAAGVIVIEAAESPPRPPPPPPPPPVAPPPVALLAQPPVAAPAPPPAAPPPGATDGPQVAVVGPPQLVVDNVPVPSVEDSQPAPGVEEDAPWLRLSSRRKRGRGADAPPPQAVSPAAPSGTLPVALAPTAPAAAPLRLEVPTALVQPGISPAAAGLPHAGVAMTGPVLGMVAPAPSFLQGINSHDQGSGLSMPTIGAAPNAGVAGMDPMLAAIMQGVKLPAPPSFPGFALQHSASPVAPANSAATAPPWKASAAPWRKASASAPPAALAPPAPAAPHHQLLQAFGQMAPGGLPPPPLLGQFPGLTAMPPVQQPLPFMNTGLLGGMGMYGQGMLGAPPFMGQMPTMPGGFGSLPLLPPAGFANAPWKQNQR